MPQRRPATPAGTPKPRLAFAGSGTITVLHGLAAQVLDLPVVLVASRQPTHAEERAAQLDAAPTTYEGLPGSADLVIVATPPECHAADATRSLEAGVGVLVEKPLCSTLAAADDLVALSASVGAPIAYGENLLYAPAVVGALEQVATLGPLVHLEANAFQDQPEWGDFLSAQRGGGVLFDLGVHPLALVLEAVPHPVVAVRAQLDRGPGLEVDDHAEVELTFADGLTARVVASWRGGGAPRWDLQAASDTGVVRLELVPNLELERDGEPLDLPLPSYPDVPQLEQFGYTQQLASVVDDLAAGRSPRVGAEFGRLVLDIVCAAYRSAGNGGRSEAVPFEGPRDRTPHQLWLEPS